MIAKLGQVCSRIAEAAVPDPFIFALLLTLVTLILGVALTPNSPASMVNHWMTGFWELLTFGMQMTLILVTGGVLAQSPPVRKLIDRVAGWPKSGGAAVMLVAFAALSTALINWGLGLIVGALMARETARSLKARGIPHHYPLIGAAGFTGLLIWHGGLSGSAPLTVATPGHFLESQIGIIPVTATLFSSLNIIVMSALLICVPLILYFMLPPQRAWSAIPEAACKMEMQAKPEAPRGFLSRLEQSRLITLIIAIMALSYIVTSFWHKGLAGLNLDSMNLSFLFLGFFFYMNPLRYMQAVSQSVSGAAGIILQFPFYAGIMGMMQQSGLVHVVSNALTSISSVGLFHLFAFISAGVVNQFVPSGGGQWAVQGPVLVEAAHSLGASIPRTVMALAYGDQWTNMIQPFWALPLLAITGLQARQIVGYTATLMILVTPLFILALLLF
ncbi:MAG TPA: TIGR00366 family protein [bacterium]